MNHASNNFSASSSSMSLQDIVKEFPSRDGKGSMVAVDHINLEVAQGELVTLLGPSGCGKTTTLRMVAGFEYPTSGQIFIGGQDIANTPPNKRDISMVFQSYALFPHMNIYENIVYGLRVKKVPEAEMKSRAREIIEMMQLSGMEDRLPSQVSGGQQQRIALARAIVIEPRILLFDEPLSNLDAKLREHMRDEIRKLQKKLGITSLYVTHDQSEAMAIADKVVIMRDGRIIQHGSPHEIYESPNSRFVADFMGKANVIPGTICTVRAGRAALSLGEKTVETKKLDGLSLASGDGACLCVRPESFRVVAPEKGLLNGILARKTYYGSSVELEVEAAGVSLIIQESFKAVANLQEGEHVGLDIDLESASILP